MCLWSLVVSWEEQKRTVGASEMDDADRDGVGVRAGIGHCLTVSEEFQKGIGGTSRSGQEEERAEEDGVKAQVVDGRRVGDAKARERAPEAAGARGASKSGQERSYDGRQHSGTVALQPEVHADVCRWLEETSRAHGFHCFPPFPAPDVTSRSAIASMDVICHGGPEKLGCW
jgi:hypothetical protein